MSLPQADGWTRRRFLGGLTLTGTAGLLSLYARPVAAEPPPETTKIRLFKVSGICIAPQYVAEEFLRGEGFTEVRYVEVGAGAGLAKALASGEAHLSLNFVAPVILRLDAGDPIVVLGGVHVGCFELFGTDRVQTIRDQKGKTVAVQELGSSQHVFLASMAAYAKLVRASFTPVRIEADLTQEISARLALRAARRLIKGPQCVRVNICKSDRLRWSNKVGFIPHRGK